MKAISKQGQQFWSNRFTAGSLHQTIIHMNEKKSPSRARRLRGSFKGGTSLHKKIVSIAGHSSSAIKHKQQNVNPVAPRQLQKSPANATTMPRPPHKAFDKNSLCVEIVQPSEAGFSRLVPLDHPLVMAYISSCLQDNRMVYVSPQMASLGFIPEMWLGKTDLRLQQVHEDDRDRLVQALQHSRNTGDKFNCLYRLYDSNGEIRWFHDEASVVLDDSGSPVFFSGVMLDITDKKNMETELKGHRYYLERHIESRTGQLMKRVALLESCNASLCDKLAVANKELAALKNQSIGQIIPSNGYAPSIQDVSADDCIEQLDGISDWARNMIGWRVSAAGTIA